MIPSAFTLPEPDRAAIDTLRAPVMLEFGTDWCGHCQAAQPFISTAYAAHPAVQHIRIEDGKGRKLGRSFGVKLWPTLVFLLDGREHARLVRPLDATSITEALTLIDCST